MAGKKTLIIGASPSPSRYAFLAANRLLQKGHEIVLLGKEQGSIGGVKIETKPLEFKDIDTVTLYINPTHQKAYYEYLIKTIKPKRIIFNPGAENPELEKLAEASGIEVEEACTLVMLSTGQY